MPLSGKGRRTLPVAPYGTRSTAPGTAPGETRRCSLRHVYRANCRVVGVRPRRGSLCQFVIDLRFSGARAGGRAGARITKRTVLFGAAVACVAHGAKIRVHLCLMAGGQFATAIAGGRATRQESEQHVRD